MNNMLRVEFFFDKRKDLENIWDKSNRKPFYGNFQIQDSLKKICVDKKFEDCAPDLEIFLKRIYSSKYIDVFREAMQKLWNNIEEEFFSRMDNLMGKKYTKKVKAYITSIGICPYNPREPSFMVSLLYPLQKAIGTCGHEIMHLYFHEFYWNDVEKEVGKKKTGDLKEALTVLLNIEFKDLLLTSDYGYEEHNELREFISESWKREKNFEQLINLCVEYLK